MKRRAAIIRAIAFGGDALILDEPFNGLDLENKQKMASLIKEQYLEKILKIIQQYSIYMLFGNHFHKELV
jgi:NitT/TauT family transport system ATP-binding protein